MSVYTCERASAHADQWAPSAGMNHLGPSEPSYRALGLGALQEDELPEPGFLKGC